MRAFPKVVVLGNCQTAGIAHAVRLFAPGARAVAARAHLIKPDKRDEWVARMADCDLIIAQELSNFGPLNISNLRQLYGSKIVTVPTFYFRGFFPDACYIGPTTDRVTSPIGEYHSVIVADSFLKGHSVAACEARFSEEEFARLGLLDAVTPSIEALTLRDTNLDVRAVPLVQRYLERHTVFMYTINHPKAFVLKDVAEAALRIAGIPVEDYDVSTTFDNLMFGPLLAIQPFLSRSLGFPVNFPRWKASLAENANRFLLTSEFIAESFKLLAAARREHIFLQSPSALASILPPRQQQAA